MDATLPAFAELHCLSHFTFLRGASSAEELVARAASLGYRALAITDECSLAGIVRAHEAALTHGLQLVTGSEIRLQDGTTLVVLATDREAYGHLSALITRGRRRAAKGHYHLERADLDDGLPGCLVLWVPPPAPGVEPAGAGTPQTGPDAHDPVATAVWLRSHFDGRLWIAAALHHGPGDAARLAWFHHLSSVTALPVVAANGVHMHVRGRRALQDVLTAIRLGTTVSAAGLALHPNGERHLRPVATLARLYPRTWLEASADIAARCRFRLDTLRYEYPEEVVPAGYAPSDWLRRLAGAGLVWRYAGGPPPWSLSGDEPPGADTGDGVPTAVRAQVERELALVAELGYEAYFLTVFDVVGFARRQEILCQGRGSAANSALCYALGITEVDPARASMLFERFISRERREPPDIDVDFEHQRREEVIQYLYRRYGRERAALTATVIRYRRRSALRDTGKALGLDAEQVERIVGSMALADGSAETAAARLREAGFDPDSRRMRQLLSLAATLEGFPRHLSQHVGGFVISRGPLSRLVPVENAAMPERSVIQWDKDDLDALGLLKVDVLALGMLTAIRRALDLAGAVRGRRLRLQDIPAEDPAVYAMLCRGDSVGVFQVESRAQMNMLPRLRPRTFHDLVIEVAIVRPGPIQGGMVHPYLLRRQGREAVTYPSPEVESVLRRTLGVPVFQEQVMQLAVVAAGFTPGESDQLRRAMAAWRRKGGLDHFETRLLEGMRARGYTDAFARQIYQQILGFGEYGFPESHAASFALLVYASAWLKCHEPAAFCAALLNSQPMGFHGPSQLIQDARRHGVEVLPVDALQSQWECTLEAPTPGGPHRGRSGGRPQPCLRLGLCLVSGLSHEGARRLLAVREAGFESFEALAAQAQLSRQDLASLARAGALAAVAGHRRAAAWTVAGMEPLPPLLRPAAVRDAVPELRPPTEGEDIVADYASLGLSLGRHPLTLLRPLLGRRRMLSSAHLLHASHGQVARVAGLVTCRQRPGTASGVVFVTLEDESGSISVVVWRDLAERQRRVLLGARLLAVHGVVERQGPVIHVVAGRLEDLSSLLGRLAVASRDFH